MDKKFAIILNDNRFITYTDGGDEAPSIDKVSNQFRESGFDPSLISSITSLESAESDPNLNRVTYVKNKFVAYTDSDLVIYEMDHLKEMSMEEKMSFAKFDFVKQGRNPDKIIRIGSYEELEVNSNANLIGYLVTFVVACIGFYFVFNN